MYLSTYAANIRFCAENQNYPNNYFCFETNSESVNVSYWCFLASSPIWYFQYFPFIAEKVGPQACSVSAGVGRRSCLRLPTVNRSTDEPICAKVPTGRGNDRIYTWLPGKGGNWVLGAGRHQTWLPTGPLLRVGGWDIFLRNSRQGTKERNNQMPALACSFVDMRECRVTPLACYTVLYFRQRRPRRIAALLQHLTRRPKYTKDNPVTLSLEPVCEKEMRQGVAGVCAGDQLFFAEILQLIQLVLLCGCQQLTCHLNKQIFFSFSISFFRSWKGHLPHFPYNCLVH